MADTIHTPEFGTTYIHLLGGVEWKVVVTHLDPRMKHESQSWVGVLAKDQHKLPAGTPVWGYIHELREVK